MMASKIDIFFKDVYNIFRQDVLPSMRYKVASIEMWEKLTSGVGSVFEKMGEVIKSFVREPEASGFRDETNADEYRQSENSSSRLIKIPLSLVNRSARYVKNKIIQKAD